MYFKRIIFLFAAACAAFAGMKMYGNIVSAETYTHQLANGMVQKVYLFGIDDTQDLNYSSAVTEAIKKFQQNSVALIQSCKASVGGYDRNNQVTLEARELYGSYLQLQGVKYEDFESDFKRNLALAQKQDGNNPFLVYYRQLATQQSGWIKGNFQANGQKDITLSHFHAFGDPFYLNGKRLKGWQVLNHYATERLSMQILDALYTSSKEHIIVCAEREAIAMAAHQLSKATSTYKEELALRSFNVFSLQQYLQEAQKVIKPIEDAVQRSMPVSKSLTIKPTYIAAVIGVALLAYFHRDIRSIISSIWQSIFGSSTSSLQQGEPASAQQRLA